MDTKEHLSARKEEMKSEIQGLTDTIRQLEPDVLIGQQAQAQIDELQTQIQLLEDELLVIHNIEASRAQYVQEEGVRYRDIPGRR